MPARIVVEKNRSGKFVVSLESATGRSLLSSTAFGDKRAAAGIVRVLKPLVAAGTALEDRSVPAPAAKGAPKAAAKPATKPAPKSTVKPAAKSTVKPAAKTATKPAPKASVKPATKTATASSRTKATTKPAPTATRTSSRIKAARPAALPVAAARRSTRGTRAAKV